MPRNSGFTPGYGPFREFRSRISGPFSFLNPTRARTPAFVSQRDNIDTAPEEEAAGTLNRVAPEFEYQWRSRDNRKGRHALILRAPTKEALPPALLPTSSPREVLRGLQRMLFSYPYWDISYLVAVLFTLGSVVWVINGFFAYLPLVQPASEFPHETLTATGVTAFIGATIFEIGSVLLLLEAVNTNREDCFGRAIERALESGENLVLEGLKPDLEECQHRHRRRYGRGKHFWQGAVVRNPKTAAGASPSPPEGRLSDSERGEGKDEKPLSWSWFVSWHDLRTHYLREIGFLASLIQFAGATIFWISGFTALPGAINMDNLGLVDGVFWTPQVIGGSCFVISGILFALETQPKWWIPAPKILGWHVGFWNLIGGIGFTLCGALGFASGSKFVYQSILATFWGSWAFLLGSALQWYECLNKFPVEIKKAKRELVRGATA